MIVWLRPWLVYILTLADNSRADISLRPYTTPPVFTCLSCTLKLQFQTIIVQTVAVMDRLVLCIAGPVYCSQREGITSILIIPKCQKDIVNT